MTILFKKLKIPVSLIVVVIILCSITITPAHAVTGFSQKSRAFVAAALTAINIVTQSATMDAASVVEYVADPMNVQYTYLDAWQDRPEIQIWDDYVTIDGVKYTDIWISNEAAEKFRVNAYDFKTAYNIASNSSATFAQGIGFANDEPIYSVNGVNKSVDYIIPAKSGTYEIAGVTVSVTYPSRVSIGGSVQTTTAAWFPGTAYVKAEANRFRVQAIGNNSVGAYGSWISKNANNWVSQNFDYNYVATNIPASEVLPEETGMMIRIPSEDSQGNKFLGDFLTEYPEFNQGEPVTIDVNLDPDIMNKLEDLIDVLIPIIPVINNNDGSVTFIENHEAPAPEPDSLLPDTWWSTVENKLDEIRQTIQNLNPDFSQIIQSIQTIPSAITQAVSNITQSITNLGDTILRDIEEGPIRLLDKLIDVLRSLFFPILATLRGFIGIWHYVVTWMSNISAPFTWIMGLMTGASPILVSPIYALIAGIIVIAVYRRFGR